MKLDPADIIDDLLPRDRELARIRDAQCEGMYLNLVDTLCRAAEALSHRLRTSGDTDAASYYQGQVDAYRAAYQHYMELR